MARKLPRLQRVLDAPALFSIAYGEIASSIYFALGIIAFHALGLTPLILFGVGLLFLLVSLSYAEGTTAVRETGGAATLVRALEAGLRGDTATVAMLCTEDIKAWAPASAAGSLDELLANLRRRDDAFDEIELEATPLDVGGDRACVEWQVAMVHTGPLSLADGAVLEGATLLGANLSDAKLTGADLAGARLEGAIMGAGRKTVAQGFKKKEQRPWWQFWG